MLYARRGGRLQSQLKAVCRDARAAPRGTRPELHTQGGGASAQRAGRAACARRGTLHALPHPAETESPTCGVAPTQSLPTSPTSLTHPTVRTGGPRGRAAAGERTRARGTTPPARDAPLPAWRVRAARRPQAPPSASRAQPPRATESELTCFEFQVINYVLNGPARHTQRVT
jgi:hypothetical protein